jgi:KaiC/GvpD/RAD55 family RecA-like ATPase
MTNSHVLRTNIGKLDEVLGGGLLSGHYIVLGEPGSGYEIMTRQILFHALQQGKSGIYVAIDSSPERIKKEMKYFNWDLKQFEEKGRFRFVDCSIYWVGLEQSSEKFFVKNIKNIADLRSAIIMARDEVGEDGVGVTETFSTLVNHIGFEKSLTLFNFLQGRLEQLNLIGLTMITSDSLPKEQVASFSAIADGIVEMRIEKAGSSPERKMRIEKYGPEHEFTGWLPYKITHEGVELTGSAKEKIKATLDRF